MRTDVAWCAGSSPFQWWTPVDQLRGRGGEEREEEEEKEEEEEEEEKGEDRMHVEGHWILDACTNHQEQPAWQSDC